MDVHTEMAEEILINLYDTSIYKISYKYQHTKENKKWENILVQMASVEKRVFR